jgi:hypothetical protein
MQLLLLYSLSLLFLIATCLGHLDHHHAMYSYHEIIELYNGSIALDILFGLFACYAIFFISLLIN